jgi:tRNA(adenine34) deaminase
LLFTIYYFLFLPFAFGAMSDNKEDQRFMRVAIETARIAEDNGDVPIGAVIVYQNRIIAKAYNQREQLQDPTAHAEIIALTQAAAALQNWHLHGCTMYVTLEPCPMCAGALVLGRLDRLVYGCDDPKTGACKSLYNIVQDERLNHRLEVTSGVLEGQCREQLQKFFAQRREQNDNNRQSRS